RDKDGLEAHGDLQSCRSSPGVREWMDEASRRLRAINGRAIGTFCCELAKDYSNRKSRDFACGLQSRAGRRKPSPSSHGVLSEPWAHFLTAAPGLPSSDSSSSTLSKSLASRKFR